MSTDRSGVRCGRAAEISMTAAKMSDLENRRSVARSRLLEQERERRKKKRGVENAAFGVY